MPKDILPNVDIPVLSVIWTYNGLSPGDMEKRIVTPSERAFHDDGQRRRAYRIAVPVRRRRDTPVFSAEREYRIGSGAGRGERAGDLAYFADRYHAAAHYSLQRVERLDHSDVDSLGIASRIVAVRLCHELRPHGSDHGTRGAAAPALRRQAARGPGRSRPAGALRARSVALRCQQCHQRAEPDSCPMAPPRSARRSTTSS